MIDDAGVCTEPELTGPVDLCTTDGRLNREAVGWSRQPVHRCALPGTWGRRKRWDYWCIATPTHVLSVTYADVDYLGLADVFFLDLTTGRSVNPSGMALGSRGLRMPERVAGGSMTFDGGRVRVAITEEASGTRLVASAPRSSGFECDVLLERPEGHESLSVVIPWSDRRFQYTNKDNTRPAVGSVRWSDQEWRFEGAGRDDGCLDFGRGKWPYRTLWNWGSASGVVPSGATVGLQLGGRWTVGTGMTENALCVDGRLSKLSEELVWEYDAGDWLRPWRIRTPRSSRVDLTFTPVHDKRSRLALGVASSEVHQCFGTYTGTVVPDSGTPLDVDGLFGWAEEARWRW